MKGKRISALDWVKKEYIIPIELETYKVASAVILGEIKVNKFDKYTERLLSIQMTDDKKFKWLKLRASVLKMLIRSYGEFPDTWRGKTVRLIVEESMGYEVIGISIE